MDVAARNLAVVRRAWDAFNAVEITTDAVRRGELAPVLEAFDRGIEWDVTEVGIPGLGKYHGHRGVRKFWLDWFEVVGDVHTEIREIKAAGDKVVTVCRQTGSGIVSGALVTWEFAIVFTMRDEKVVHADVTPELDAARHLASPDAASLSR